MSFLKSLPDDASPGNVFAGYPGIYRLWAQMSQALRDALAVTARAAFMQRLVEGHGFMPMTRAIAAEQARRRVEHGYVNLYPAFRESK